VDCDFAWRITIFRHLKFGLIFIIIIIIIIIIIT